MDLQGPDATAVKYLIRDRDSKYTTTFDTILTDSGITTITTGIRVPRMNTIMERWIRTCRTKLLDRTLIHNQRHTYSTHSTNTKTSTTSTSPTAHSTPQHHNARYRNPITDPAILKHLDIQRQDRLSGILNEYHHAA